MNNEQINQGDNSILNEDVDPPPSTNSQWTDWHWQMRNRIKTIEQLTAKFQISQIEEDVKEVIKKYPMAITPYYASLIKKLDYSDPIFSLSMPNRLELTNSCHTLDDPLHEEETMPVPNLVHRYRDRALLMVTSTCSTNCRHCTRKRMVGVKDTVISKENLEGAKQYLISHPEISDVIVSGGDPLVHDNCFIESILKTLREVKSVQVIRIGTRTPVVMPMRITSKLVNMLKKYRPWINTHFNHPQEVTKESIEACEKIVDAGIPLGNQSVLLKGVNDDPLILEDLYRKLVSFRCRPYYLFLCDYVQGVDHFITSLNKGIEIMDYLRGRLSGIAIPTFVVDSIGGKGKIPILPSYIVENSSERLVLRNYKGEKIEYPVEKTEEILVY